MTLYLLHWLSRSQGLCLLPTLRAQGLPKKRNKKGNQTKYFNSGYSVTANIFQAGNLTVGCCVQALNRAIWPSPHLRELGMPVTNRTT